MKNFLVACILVAGVPALAQVNAKHLKVAPLQMQSSREPNTTPFKKNLNVSAPQKAQATCGTIFTGGPNAFGVGGSPTTVRQNCLSYNSDLNAVLWTQRASPGWTFSGYTSGAIQATWLNVATGVWDSMIIYRDSVNGYRARYPGGIFYNMPGNTNMANAYVAGIGPACNTQWSGTWYGSRQVTGNYHSVTAALDTNKFCGYGTVPFGNIAGGNVSLSGSILDFLNADMQQAGNTIYVGGPLTDLNVTSTNPIYGGTIGKATNLTWSRDTIVPGFYMNPANEYATDGQGVRLAFSPDGQTGYAVFIGRLAANFNNGADSTLSPIVYRTTNGGATWSSGSILPNYDWSLGHPEMLRNVGTLRPAPAKRFKLFLNHGVDLTVDSTGTLHLVATVTDPYLGAANNSVDSLMYSYQYAWDYRHSRPLIWDMMTDGTTWNTLLVDSIHSASMGNDPAADTTAPYNPWSDGGTTFMAYGARIQVSRSVTGGKIFYSWADSDSSITATLYNTNPEVYMKSYDITNGTVSQTFSVTPGNGDAYFHFMSDVSYYDAGQAAWVCPLVYTTSKVGGIPLPGQTGVDYHYTNCAVFAASMYTDSASVYRTMGGAGIASNTAMLNSITQNFPNPFSQTTNIVVTLKQTKNIDLKVFDVLGNVVFSKTKKGTIGENTFVFDGTGSSAGVYYYTVSVDGERVTKKMILQK